MEGGGGDWNKTPETKPKPKSKPRSKPNREGKQMKDGGKKGKIINNVMTKIIFEVVDRGRTYIPKIIRHTGCSFTLITAPYLEWKEQTSKVQYTVPSLSHFYPLVQCLFQLLRPAVYVVKYSLFVWQSLSSNPTFNIPDTRWVNMPLWAPPTRWEPPSNTSSGPKYWSTVGGM